MARKEGLRRIKWLGLLLVCLGIGIPLIFITIARLTLIGAPIGGVFVMFPPLVLLGALIWAGGWIAEGFSE